MRITFVLPTPNLGGGIKVVAIYARYLKAFGHQVQLVSVPPISMSILQKSKAFLRGRRWPSESTPKSHLSDQEFNHVQLERWRPVVDADLPDADVVIATWWETAEWVSRLNPSKGAKVYFVQGHEVFDFLPAQSRDTYKLPLRKIVVSKWLQNIMHAQYGETSVDLVPNSVDHAVLFAERRGKQNHPTIGFLFSPAPFKGAGKVLKAVERIRKAFPTIKLVSFGTDYPAPEQFPMDSEFHFQPPQLSIRDIYSKCDVWVSASSSEGFNLPVMEAMACRTPVVATRTGWPEEAIQTGQNGVLIDVGDDKALVEGVCWILSRSEAEWRTLSDNAFKTVAPSSWSESAKLFEKALETARAVDIERS